jgi:excisionase family DNA binding protein
MHHQVHPSPLAISIKETCALLGLSRYSVCRLVNLGRIKSCKAGRRVLVSLDSIRTFVNCNP